MKGEIQALLFSRDSWTRQQAGKWLKEHKIKPMKQVHTTETFHRYRLQDPRKYKLLRFSRFNDGIKAIVGYF